MKKNLLVIVAIVMSIIAIGVAWQRKDVEISSLTLKDSAGNVFAIIDAERRQFTIYNPNGKEAVEIETVEDGTNVIVKGKDGFERIRLSTGTSEGSYIHILRDGWQDNPGGASPMAVHIDKNGVHIDKNGLK